MSSNPRNNGQLIGRLASDPRVFTNKDGSKTVLMNIYADRDYKDRSGNRGSDAVPVEAYIAATVQGLGPYSLVHRGDLVSINYALRMDSYNKNGETVYDLKVAAESIALLESRTVVQERVNKRLNEASQTPAQPAGAVDQQAAAAALGTPMQQAPAQYTQAPMAYEPEPAFG